MYVPLSRHDGFNVRDLRFGFETGIGHRDDFDPHFLKLILNASDLRLSPLGAGVLQRNGSRRVHRSDLADLLLRQLHRVSGSSGFSVRPFAKHRVLDLLKYSRGISVVFNQLDHGRRIGRRVSCCS
jgi:hypothetical protein